MYATVPLDGRISLQLWTAMHTKTGRAPFCNQRGWKSGSIPKEMTDFAD
jgi:hypothetical protein